MKLKTKMKMNGRKVLVINWHMSLNDNQGELCKTIWVHPHLH